MSAVPSLRRRFLDWSEPALPALIRTLAEEESDGQRLDLAHLLLVFPGRRPARRVVELLVEEAEERGLVLTPPATTHLGALPERLYEPARPLADGVVSRRIWARALRDTPAGDLEAVVPEPPRDADLPGWARLARIAHGLHREVGGEGLGFDEVAAACRRGVLSFDDSERWDVLARVRRRWLGRLEALGRADRYVERIRALEEGAVRFRPSSAGEGPAEIHVVGAPEVPGVTGRMLRAAADGGTPVVAWVHGAADEADRFDDLGRVVPPAWPAPHVPVPDEVLSVRDGPAEEASEALRILAGWGGRFAPDEVTVGIPDPELAPWLEQRFSAYGVPHREAAGTPLERTAPFRLLEATARHLDGRRFPDLAALLRHPDLEARLAELVPGAPALETADAYFSEHLPSLAAEPLAGGGRGGAGRHTGRMRALLRALEGERILGSLAARGSEARRPLSGWMPEILGFLRRVYGARELRRDRPAQRRVVEACARIREAAACFHRLPDGADDVCAAPAAIRLLLGELRGPDAAIPPEPDRAAVELLGWLELHLDDAPALVLTGVDDAHLPEAVGGHPFLPNRLRAELGLRDDAARFARDAYLLTAILRSREAVRLVAGRSDSAGDPRRPSRLLLTDPGPDLARRLLRFVTRDQGSPPLPPLGAEASEQSAFRVPPEPRIRLATAPETFRVTEFRTLLRDPYRWALERHLGLEELHDRERELNPLRFGILAHDVLKAFGESPEAHAADPAAVARRLEAVLDELVSARFGRSLPAVPVQIEQLRTRLRAFARWHAEWVSEGWRIWATEVEPAGEGVPFDVDGRPVHLRGRIDRIDVHREAGRIAVFDYKSGDRPADPGRAHRARSGEWRDLQLPLYRHLLPHLADAEGRGLSEIAGPDPGLRLGYLRLPKEEGAAGPAFLEWEEAVLRAADEEARRLIRWLRERDAVEFDPERSSTSRWDPLGWILGRGVLATARDDDGDDEE